MRRPQAAIVTPCLNSERFIAETVRSVVNSRAVLSKEVDLQYCVVDGGSTDKTLEIVERELEKLPSHIHSMIISEPDAGIYDALAKGFARAEGDIFGYINAGDFYSPTALEIAGELLGRDGVEWLTGFTTLYSERSDIVYMRLPYRYRKRLIRSGMYGTGLAFIQQESTFWTTRLQARVDLDKLKTFHLAGDYYLWRTFAEYADLDIVEAWLGGFKLHRGQLSEDRHGYKAELRSVCDGPGFLDYWLAGVDSICGLMPNRVKKILNKGIFVFNPESGQYIPVGRDALTGSKE